MTMNQKVLCKRIMGLLFVFAFFSFLPVDVSAKKVKCENYLTNIKYIHRYNLTMRPIPSLIVKYPAPSPDYSDYYEIKMEPNTADADLKKKLRKVVFKVVKINNVAQNGSETVSYGNPLTLFGSFVSSPAGDKVMEVTLESTESSSDPDCTGKVTVVVGITKEGEEITQIDPIDGIIDSSTAFDDMKPINCDAPKDSFETSFCNVKNSVPDSKKYEMNYGKHFSDVFTSSSSKADQYGNYLLKCDVKKFDTTGGYYVNQTSFYGYGLKTISNNYLYHYSPGVEPTSEKVSCDVNCEEAVLVEYGPPIASKAGLCFEYKVRVTSRVSCSVVNEPKPPTHTAYYCTPTPLCYNAASDTTTNQGGPNEEFDSCIEECDGGKYTDRCSKSCYKKVYGKSNSKSKKTSTLDLDYSVKKLADNTDPFSLETCISESAYGGCYYRSGGSIRWSPGTVEGRWYKVSPHKDLSEYKVFENGIYRHVWSAESHCQDDCWWSGCSNPNVYLNPGIAQKDYNENKKIYNTVVSQCKASASCTTSQATFTISVNYKDKKNEVHSLEFPYTQNEDTLTSKGEGASIVDTSNRDDTTLLCNNLNDNFGVCSRGCYDDGSLKKLYRAEWSFPGSWIDGKTGKIKYEPESGTSWQSIKDKFCIPLDAQDVNRKWWNYYQLHNPEFDIDQSSISSSEYETICKNGYEFKRITSISENDIADWNINAITNNFGYYGWNFHISCFYALNRYPSVIEDGEVGEIPKECKSDSSYRVRTVDLNNLFPATDKDLDDVGATSRTPGFNWSKYATKDDSKKVEDAANKYYTIEPSEYAKTVQELGENVYNERYLDYSIDLTREKIVELRGKAPTAYNEFPGEVKIKSGYVVNYHSPLFVNGGALSNSIHPTEDSLKCNNMKNYKDGCEE